MSPALRVAVIGAGPSGLYAAVDLLKRHPEARVDVFDRLPVPGGLVRSGVSPDHALRRAVIAVCERLALGSGRFRYFGNMTLGEQFQVQDLREHYHATLFASGAGSDRRLGIPGEDLPGSHPATAFVGWYNCHPDHAGQRFDLSAERAVVVGNGNVALDVARMLLLPVDELRHTDMADHALDALAESRVREVVILGRRGPAQAAFTAPELLELATLQGVDIAVEGALPERVVDAGQALRLQLLRELQQRPSSGAGRRLVLRFLSSPEAILGSERVEALRIARNRLVEGAGGEPRAEATGETEMLETGLVFRSVGYRAEPLPGLPFDPQRAVLPNADGRVLDPERGHAPLPGCYVAGWLKRGPSGVIGTNKICSRQTVTALLADAAAGRLGDTPQAGSELPALLQRGRTELVDYDGWKRIDRQEQARGAPQGRPRARLASVAEMLLTANA
ncbi:MAG TPA: FAD-dependent oxidoreductase [Solimonas sp.]